MNNYLSLGGGVNSWASYLIFLDEGIKFEAVYVQMPDWPETHEYMAMMKQKGYPFTIISPKKGRFTNLYDNCWEYRMFSGFKRWCTVAYKVEQMRKYYKKHC